MKKFKLVSKTEEILKRLEPTGVIRVDVLAMQRRLIDVWRKIHSRPKDQGRKRKVF